MSTAEDVVNEQGTVPSALRPMLAELRRGLERLYGDRLDRVVLYGSHARGEAHDGSDVDVLVVLQGSVNHLEEVGRLTDVVYALLQEYGELVSVLPMSEQEFHSRRSPLHLNVRREGIAL